MASYRLHFTGILFSALFALVGCSAKEQVADGDLIYIDSMRVHQQRSIELARQAEQQTSRPEIKEMARHIIAEQSEENAKLNTLREKWYKNAPQATHIHGATIHVDHSPSPGAANSDPDLDFLDRMIKHHEETIRISQQALEGAKRPEVRQFADSFISDEQVEIEKMKAWMTAWQKR